MPSKRQPSKQRRAAQNRASRAQRAARAQRAGELQASASERSGDDSTAGSEARPGGRSGGLLSGLFGGGAGGGTGGGRASAAAPGARPGPQGLAGGLIATAEDGTRLPGARATFISVVLAAFGFVFLLAVPSVQVDDRGEPLPLEFQGVYLEARTLISGSDTTVEPETVTVVDAVGPIAIAIGLLPLAVAAGAYWMHRRTARSIPLTVGMLVLAVVVFLFGGVGTQYFIPALIAMAIGSFQVRKAEMPARMAEREARRAQAGSDGDEDLDDEDEDEVIDVDSIDADDEDLDDDELDDDDDDDVDDELDDEYDDDEDLDDEDMAPDELEDDDEIDEEELVVDEDDEAAADEARDDEGTSRRRSRRPGRRR